jgi:hypothetical protein
MGEGISEITNDTDISKFLTRVPQKSEKIKITSLDTKRKIKLKFDSILEQILTNGGKTWI